MVCNNAILGNRFWNILDVCINFILWRDVWMALPEAVNFRGNLSSGMPRMGSPAGPPAWSVAGLAMLGYLSCLIFGHWGSYYRRQPVRQAGGQQSLRQLLRYQDWSYARWPCYSFSATGHNSRHSALHIALTPNGNRPWTDVLHIIKHRSTTPKSMTPTAPSCIYNSWRSTWSETYFRQDLRGQRPISVKNAL